MDGYASFVFSGFPAALLYVMQEPFPNPPLPLSAPPGKFLAPDRRRSPLRPAPAGCSCRRGPVAPDRASPSLAERARRWVGRG